MTQVHCEIKTEIYDEFKKQGVTDLNQSKEREQKEQKDQSFTNIN